MGRVGGHWIAAALIPALLITILFFFDHNVSAQLAQQVNTRHSRRGRDGSSAEEQAQSALQLAQWLGRRSRRGNRRACTAGGQAQRARQQAQQALLPGTHQPSRLCLPTSHSALLPFCSQSSTCASPPPTTMTSCSLVGPWFYSLGSVFRFKEWVSFLEHLVGGGGFLGASAAPVPRAPGGTCVLPPGRASPWPLLC